MGVKIKEAKLVEELTDDCLFPISDGSGEPKVADFSKVKNLLGDAKQVESTVTNIQKKISYLTRNGLDSELSVKDITERVINPTSTNVETLIGNDFNKSVRTIASEVLAGASTGGGIDLDLYLSKSEAEATYEKKGVGYTKGEVDTKINEAVRINGEELFKKADKETVENLSERIDQAETNIVNNSNLLSAHSQDILALQIEQENQKTTIQEQGIAILALDMEVDGVKADVSKANKSIETINAELDDKADKSDVEGLSKSINTNKSVLEIIAPQVAANTEAIKGKVDKSSVDTLSERVDQAEDDIEILQTEQGTQKAAIQQQAQNIANLNTRINGVNESVSEANEAIEAIEITLENKADLENGKIPTGQLPDYILGQLLFGGTASGGTADELMIYPSLNYQQKHKIPSYQETVTIAKDTFKYHEGEYFIATVGFTAFGIPVSVGDWIVSTGVDWRRIDNTDAITKVAGIVPEDGNIPKAGLIEALGVDNKYEKPSSGIPKSDLEEEVQTSLDKIDSIDNKVEQTEYDDKVAELETSIADNKDYIDKEVVRLEGYAEEVANAAETVAKTYTDGKIEAVEGAIGSKYTKPAGGIPEKDLAFEVVTEKEMTNAISAAAADLNGKIDNKFDKTDILPAEHVGGLSGGANGLASDNSIIANRVPYLKADAFAFLKPEDFTIEVAYDGSTWVELDSNDPKLLSMFTMKNYTEGFLFDGYTGSWGVDSKVRITIAPPTTSPRNSHIDFITVSMFCNMWEYGIESEYYDMRRGAWIKAGSTSIGTYDNIAYIKYGQYFAFNAWSRWGARLTFTVVKPYTSYSRILSISGFGSIFNGTTPNVDNAPYTLGTLWDWDYLKNVYFPNDIYEGGMPLKNKYASISKMPTELPNPKPLTIQINNLPKQTYKGDTETNLIIYAPSVKGGNNQVVKFMDGVSANWGYVKWEEIEDKPDVINFAKDLTGVLEATPEEFTYRPSAGNKSIRDEGAVIRRIKGNTTVWGQLADITASFTNSGYILERSGDRMSFSITRVGSSATSFWCSLNMKTAYRVLRHKYLFVADAEASNIASNADYVSVTNYSLTIPNHNFNLRENRRELYSCISTPLETSTSWQFAFYAYGNAKLTIHNLQCFDLTSIFGAGNEPATYEEFNAIYPDIYPYCEPEIRNVKTTAIETIGFNLFNGEYADLIGGKTYYVGGADITGLTFTPQGSSTSFNIVLSTDRTFTPTQSGRLYSTEVDTCVHFQHSGIKDGECADYVKHTLELPEIAEYFHEGMNGIGDVYDEINSENTIQRIGVVDIGTLEWYTGIQKHMFIAPIENAKQTVWNEVPNAIMLPYTAVSRIESDTADMSFCVNNVYNVPNRLCLTNFNYEDAASFKAAMSGVYLYYELAEPVVRPIIEPIQLVYDVEDFGTENAIGPENSAPFRADIVYQFNAEGRIRDNGRNIERLETAFNSRFDYDGMEAYVVADGLLSSDDKYYYLPSLRSDNHLYNLATEQYVINSIPTEVATATQIRTFEYTTGITPFIPNIMYECSRGLADNETIPIPLLYVQQDGYDHVWMIRFPAIGVSNKLSYPFDIRWKDGTAPRFTTACTLELYFKKIGGNVIIGEWKIYR